MDRHVLSGQVVIIPVIGIKIFHFLAVERNFEDAAVAFDLEIAVVGAGIDPGRQGEIHLEADQQFLCLPVFMICVVIGLGAGDRHLHLFQIRKGGQGQKPEETLHVGLIVQDQAVQHVKRRQEKIFFVGIDQLFPVGVLCAPCPQAGLHGLLPVIRQSQKMAVGSDVGIQIYGFHGQEGGRIGDQTVEIHACPQKGKIEAVAVVIDDVFVFSAEDEKRGKDHFLIHPRIVEPLCHLPSLRLQIDTADEIDCTAGAADACGLNIQKQDLLRYCRHIRQQEADFLIDRFADDTHSLPFALVFTIFVNELSVSHFSGECEYS